jgi:DNA invertase Pin-like site-specific DNA recombinase
MVNSLKRAAPCARVSTGEDRQDPETQLQKLREYAQRRGFEAAGEYVDTSKRP